MIGYKFINSAGVYWRSLPFGYCLLSPASRLENFTSKDARQFLINNNTFFVRWETAFDGPSGSWWHVIKDGSSNFDLSSYSSNTRSKIRRGLKSFDIRQVDKSLILELGYNVYLSSFSRYSTFESCLTEECFIFYLCF